MSAAIIIRLQNRFMRRFREAGAITQDRAIPISAIGMHRSWVFDRMVRRGVFVHVGDDRYFMEEPQAATFVVLRRRRMLIWLLVVMLAVFALTLVGTIRW